MVLFLLHRTREGRHRVVASVSDGVVDHARIGPGVFPGFAGDHVSQVNRGAFDCPRHLQVAHAVEGFGAGDLLENLGDLRMPLIARLLRVRSVGEMGDSLGDDGLPEVPVGVGNVGHRVG